MGAWLTIAGIGCLIWWSGQRRQRAPSQPQPFADLAPEATSPPAQMPPLIEPRKSQAGRRLEKHPVRWMQPGETAEAAGFKLTGGLFYFGIPPKASDYRDRRATAHVINPSLSAAAFASDVTGEKINYWPHYAEISPAERRAYLQWHSTGRRDPEFGIGYVFLFFYGLEYHLFADKKLADVGSIASEVRELLSVYGSNYAFQSYARKFLAATRVLVSDLPASPELSIDLVSTYELPADFRLALSHRLNDGRIGGDWLLAWYLQHPEKSLRTPAKRCFEEFKDLFLLRFSAQYPSGLRIKKSVKKLRLEYQFANGWGTLELPVNSGELTDPVGLTAPIKIAAALAAECSEALDGYSRLVGKNPASANSAGARMLLPNELKTSLANSAGYKDMRQEIERLLQNEVQPVSLAYLLEIAGLEFEKGERVSTAVANQLIGLLEHMDIGLEPDPRFGNKLPAKDKDVVIFRTRDAGKEMGSTDLIAARILVEVSVLAASIDGNDEQAGLQSALTEISKFPNLVRDEFLRIFAYFVYLSRAGNKSANWQRLSNRPVEERERIAHVALCALTADGRIEAQEIRFAERLYQTLGLPKDRLYGDLHARTGDEPKTVKAAEPQTGSVKIPPRPHKDTALSERTAATENKEASREPVPGDPVFVDEELLARTRKDTAEVQQLLNQIYSLTDDTPEAKTQPQILSIPQTFHGLDRGHEAILALFLAHGGSLGRTLLETELNRLGLFVDGALETINEWSFGHFEEPLIEDGEPLHLAAHLIPKLK